jgi:DNA-binding CsgD family transcriptional regulator/tetratricopeptide (TPR) repeat protein
LTHRRYGVTAVRQRVTSPTIVGRAQELDLLRADLQHACSGDPQAVFVAGEAGVGKSRLVTEFAASAERAGAWTLVGQCIPTHDGIAFAPVVGILRRLHRQFTPAMFDHLVGGAREELARLVPALAPASQPATATDLTLDWTRGRLFELVLKLLGRLSEETCVVLLLEDLHWSDRSTQDLVSFLVRELDGERVLLIGTYRSDEMGADHPVGALVSDLVAAGRAQRVGLRRLDRSQTAEQLAAITGATPPAALVDRIHGRSEGNPFFTEELLASRADEQDLPRTVRDTLRARVATLSELARDVLRVAAVAGRTVDHRLLSNASAMGEPELTVALREAVDRHMIVPHDDSYTFRHALLRETVYRSLLPGERRALHEAYARALTQRLASSTETDVAAVTELAHHWREAGDAEAALSASLRAARAAMASSAFAEAHVQYEHAIDLWPQVHNAEEQARVTRVDLLGEAAEAANHRGDHDRAIDLLRTAIAQADASPGDERGSLRYSRLAHYLWEAGDMSASFQAAESAARIAPDVPSSVARAQALTGLARSRMLTGRLAEARALAEQALAASQAAGAQREESTARQVLGLLLVLLGEPEEGTRHVDAANRLAVAIDHVEEIAASAATLSVALTSQGRFADAEARLREVTLLARKRGFARSYGLWLIANHAYVLYKLGRWAEAARLAADVADPRHTATQVASRLAHLVLAQLDTGRGELEAARAHVRTVQQITARQWIDRLPAVAAELELWTGHPDRARALVDAGLSDIPQARDPHSDAPALCWLGVRAEADLAERARPRSDGATLLETIDTADRLRSRSRAIARAATRIPEAAMYAAAAEAEHARAHGTPDPSLWTGVAARADDLGLVYVHAYARWREAGAWLTGEPDRQRATGALRTAHDLAASLGARPLIEEVQQLARYARLELTDEPAAAEASAAEPSAADRLGLTPREIDVLTLVAEGRTNVQIGKALFISDKTASVHVSHILAKLGASNRVEAAGIAHRLGLVEPPS